MDELHPRFKASALGEQRTVTIGPVRTASVTGKARSDKRPPGNDENRVPKEDGDELLLASSKRGRKS
jgi:hypothetical protein